MNFDSLSKLSYSSMTVHDLCKFSMQWGFTYFKRNYYICSFTTILFKMLVSKVFCSKEQMSISIVWHFIFLFEYSVNFFIQFTRRYFFSLCWVRKASVGQGKLFRQGIVPVNNFLVSQIQHYKMRYTERELYQERKLHSFEILWST